MLSFPFIGTEAWQSVFPTTVEVPHGIVKQVFGSNLRLLPIYRLERFHTDWKQEPL
jgi:hypothetical protein